MATSTSRVATSNSASTKKSGGEGGGVDGKGEAPAKKSKKKLIIIGVVVVLVLGVGAKMTVLKAKPAVQTAAQLAAKKASTPPEFGPIIPLAEQTLNLADGHFLKLTVVIQLKKTAKAPVAATDGTTTAALSAASQAVIQTYGGYTQVQLTGAAAQTKAKEALVKALNPIYPQEVADIYTPEFLMSS